LIMIRPFIALFITTFSLLAGMGMLGTYLPLLLTIRGSSAQLVGFVMSAYYLGMFMGGFTCHRLIKNVGHIRAFAAFAAVTTTTIMLHGMFVLPLFWACLRFFTGVANFGMYMVIESWLNECTEPKSRGRVLSVYMVINYLGVMTGQQFLNCGDIKDSRMVFIIGILAVLSVIPIVTTRSIHPDLPAFEKFSIPHLFRRAPVGMLGCLTAGLLTSSFYALGPVFCHQLGLSTQALSLFMTVTIFGGMFLQWPMGIISDRFDRTLVLSMIGLGTAFVSTVIIIAGKLSLGLLMLLMPIYGGLVFTVYSISVARAHDVFEQHEIVPVSSVLLLCYGTGATAGPILASATMGLFHSPFGLFLYCGFIAILYFLVTFYLRAREISKVVPTEEHVGFVVMKTTSPVAVLLHPGADAINELESEDAGQTDDEG
jgi:MFS family permease